MPVYRSWFTSRVYKQNVFLKAFTLYSLSVFLFVTGFINPARAALPAYDSQGQAVPSLAPMLKKVTPGVVNIYTTSKIRIQQNPLFNDPFFRHFFDMPSQPRERTTQSLGSGVIVDAANGFIVTNHHVIANAHEIRVTLSDGETLEAKLIGSDPATDVAIIQVKAKGLTAVPRGNSDQVQVGDFAVAIGNPFGLQQTVTSGIISAIGRSGLGIEGYEDFIQTDASINPGNSGGALINLRGELIGINTAIFSKSGGNIGIGFAIPINMVNSVMQQLIAHGEVDRGQLGAEAQDLTPELAKAFGINRNKKGAIITAIEKGSAAGKAGLRPGDIVVSVNGKMIKDSDSLRNAIGLLRVGETVDLVVIRDGNQRRLSARISKTISKTSKGKALHRHLGGAQLTDIEEGSRLHGKIEGVLVADVKTGSPAYRAGLRKGDVITSVNRTEVKSVNQMAKAIKKGKALLINIRRRNGSLFLYLQ